MKLTVLLDCDGVLADFDGRTKQDVLNLKGSLNQTHFEWSIEETFGLTKKEKSWVKAQRSKPGWCFSIEPYPSAVEGVKKLKAIADVHVLTSPWMSDFWVPERYKWLQKHFGIGHDDVTFTHQKHRTFGHVLVDDKESHHMPWRDRHGPNSYLWANPYNVPVNGSIFHRSVQYTDNWDQLVSDVAFLSNLVK